MTEPAPAPPRTAGRSFAYLALALAVFGIVVAAVGWREVVDAARGARPLPLLGMAVLLAGGAALRVLKWRYALGPGSQAAALFFLAKNAGNWTPGRAGELAPLLLRDHRNLRVAAWLLADRALEAALTLWFGLAALAWLRMTAPAIAAATAAAAAAVGCGAAAALYAWHPPQTPPAWWPRSPRAQRAHGALIRLHAELHRLGRRSAGILALTVLAKLADFQAVVLMCAAFGYDAPLLLAAAARCAHALVGAAPIAPDASGVPYMAQAWLLHEYAAMPYATLAAALALEAAAVNAVLYAGLAIAAPGLRSAGSSGAPRA